MRSDFLPIATPLRVSTMIQDVCTLEHHHQEDHGDHSHSSTSARWSSHHNFRLRRVHIRVHNQRCMGMRRDGEWMCKNLWRVDRISNIKRPSQCCSTQYFVNSRTHRNQLTRHLHHHHRGMHPSHHRHRLGCSVHVPYSQRGQRRRVHHSSQSWQRCRLCWLAHSSFHQDICTVCV